MHTEDIKYMTKIWWLMLWTYIYTYIYYFTLFCLRHIAFVVLIPWASMYNENGEENERKPIKSEVSKLLIGRVHGIRIRNPVGKIVQIKFSFTVLHLGLFLEFKLQQFLMMNIVTLCCRSETPGSHVCQQQAVAVHLHLHWAASHSPSLDQTEHSREETCGIKTEKHSFIHTCFMVLFNFFLLELPETLTIHLISHCCRWPFLCTWTSQGLISSSPSTSTSPPRKTRTASTSAASPSCARSSRDKPHSHLHNEPRLHLPFSAIACKVVCSHSHSKSKTWLNTRVTQEHKSSLSVFGKCQRR